MHDRKQPTTTIISQRNGPFIQKLTLCFLDNTLLTSIAQFCPNITFLHLHLDHHSSRVQYPILSTFFSRMHTNLTSLYIHFDASLYPLSLLWGISNLTNLIRLDFDVFYSDYYDTKHHPPELYMSILQCCPTLQIFIGYGSFLEQSKRSLIYNKDSKLVRLKRIIIPRALGLPSHPPVVHMPHGYDIRYLHVRPPSIDVPTFHKILAQCPLLERLSIDHGYWNIVTETWTILATHCPFLRDLQVWNGHLATGLQLPDSTALFYLLPKLETLCLNVVRFPEMIDSSNLKGCRQQYEVMHGIQEPPLLTSLTITGPNNRAFIILLYALTALPELESLTVGSTHTLHKTFTHDVQPSSLGHLYDFTVPWACQESLAWLDVASISFPNEAILRQFFGFVGSLPSLTTFYVAISHLRTLMVNISTSMNITFPTVTTLRVSPWLSENGVVAEAPLSWEEVIVVIEAFPRLEKVILLGRSGLDLVDQLSATFPSIDFATW